ncbi:class I adenylate-forming enzyme family protein [Propylenella binzhouense]|uniref:Long-chain fatty acid--CoA ligase n=1 Tax=Propylenella binzhouense TaxID=2555902 RepID=A0A964T269_9HYPH|nr:class I adenylate-forming enzyme family protein [Propylenella binzhouense]MYZ47108.1 long-chain fatty acid--CoA ligase [Propylenella binzhouense]
MQNVFGDHQLDIPFQSIADLLAKYAVRDPMKRAIVDLDQGKEIAFGKLKSVADDIAGHLNALGVGKGDKVLLLSDECVEKLLIWLGIWRLGAVVCPLNIELNSEHLIDLSRLADPKLVLHHKDIDVSQLAADYRCIRFAGWTDGGPADPEDAFFSALPSGTDPASLPERNEPADLACIFCTSGTTSRPKMVVYDHAAYWLSGLSTLDMLGLTEDDRTLEYRSFGWNSAQILSFMPFLEVGCTLHIAKRFSHSRFFEWIQKYGITFSAGVPTVVNMLLNKPLGYTGDDIPTLRLMTCSTAPLSPEQWTKFETMYGIKLLQLYGMSEAGWICGNRHYKWKRGTVGLPAKHQEFAIVDEAGNVCPPGVEGEVTIGGPQTALGTLRDDGSLEPVRGLRTKTGDLAVRDDEGFITVTGRTKDLIIRGGMNISPVEIDNVLMSSDLVFEGAAVGVPDPIYGEEVVCVVVPKRPDVTPEQILEFCKSRLPHAKVPKRVYMAESLPKSDRGKVLRDKLRESLPSLQAMA